MTRENLPHPADVESCLQITGRVDVPLRDRIAAALRNLSGPEASGHPLTYEGMADAVIEALGLTVEAGVIVGCAHE